MDSYRDSYRKIYSAYTSREIFPYTEVGSYSRVVVGFLKHQQAATDVLLLLAY